MTSRAVHWEEGMSLTPQHFQAADRHARRNLCEVEDWFHPFDWGFRSIVYDVQFLSTANLVIVRACQARFLDGTRLSVGEGLDVPDLRLDLTEILNPSDRPGKSGLTVTVFLAVPSFDLGIKNVETPTSPGARYALKSDECADENSGSDRVPITFRKLQARLMHSGENFKNYETLRLFTIHRSATDLARPEVDETQVPPLLILDAWPWLRDRVQGIVFEIESRVRQLASQAAGRDLSFRGQDAGDTERLLKLSALNEVAPPLRLMAFTAGFTPLAVYVELCRAAGRLGVFLPDRTIPQLPPYDHHNLSHCFTTVIEQIRKAMEGAEPIKVVLIPFTRENDHIQVRLQESWCEVNEKHAIAKRMFLGVQSKLSEQECDLFLQNENEGLDRSVGSGIRVEALFEDRDRGLALIHLKRVPNPLPNREGLVFYAIKAADPWWGDVVHDHSLAIKFNPDEVSLGNDEEVTIKTRVGRAALLQSRGREAATLRFTLYVVPSK